VPRKVRVVAVSDDALLTVVFWLVAVVLFVVVYLVPVAITVTGALLLRSKQGNRTVGSVMLIGGAVLCVGVVFWKVFDFLSYNSN
jgi:hypothetical protein